MKEDSSGKRGKKSADVDKVLDEVEEALDEMEEKGDKKE